MGAEPKRKRDLAVMDRRTVEETFFSFHIRCTIYYIWAEVDFGYFFLVFVPYLSWSLSYAYTLQVISFYTLGDL